MNNASINIISDFWQDRLEGKVTKKGLALLNLTHSVIREYGKYSHNNYSVDVMAISLADKRLVVSHFEAAEWLEWCTGNATRIEALFSDHAKYFQELVDNECFAVYCEDQEEAGALMCKHPNYDEVYWVRR